MDLSTGGDLRKIRKMILALNVPVGTVPIYEAVRKAGNVADVDSDILFNVIREHCREGVDFLTLHCGVNYEALAALTGRPTAHGGSQPWWCISHRHDGAEGRGKPAV